MKWKPTAIAFFHQTPKTGDLFLILWSVKLGDLLSSLPLWGFCTNLSDVFYKVKAHFLASEIASIIVLHDWHLEFNRPNNEENWDKLIIFYWLGIVSIKNASVIIWFWICSIVTFRLWNEIVKIRYGGIGTVLSIPGRVIELDLWMSKRQKYILTDGTGNPRFSLFILFSRRGKMLITLYKQHHHHHDLVKPWHWIDTTEFRVYFTIIKTSASCHVNVVDNFWHVWMSSNPNKYSSFPPMTMRITSWCIPVMFPSSSHSSSASWQSRWHRIAGLRTTIPSLDLLTQRD